MNPNREEVLFALSLMESAFAPCPFQSARGLAQSKTWRACQRPRDSRSVLASALRGLGKRWLKILWRLWQNRECYDESKHLRSLERRDAKVWQKIKPTLVASPQTVPATV